MKYLLLILSLSTISIGLGQKNHWGITFGGTLAWTDSEGQVSDAVNGLTVDGYYTYKHNHFISKSSLAFQQNGNSRKLVYQDTTGFLLTPTTEKRRFSYLAMNQLAGIEFGKRIKFYVAAGLNLAYYLNTGVSAHDVSGNGVFVKGYNYNERSLSPLDLAASVETGLGVELFNDDHFFIIGSYNHGILAVSNTKYTGTPKWNNNFMTIRIGVRHIVKPRIKTEGKPKDSKGSSTFDSQ